MYVKIVTGRGTPGGEESQLFAVGKQVRFGTRYTDAAPSETCWPDELRIEGNALCHHRIESEDPTGHHAAATPNEKGEPWWAIHWAWWWAPSSEAGHHSIEAVITDGEMFVMDDQGNTIERVR